MSKCVGAPVEVGGDPEDGLEAEEEAEAQQIERHPHQRGAPQGIG